MADKAEKKAPSGTFAKDCADGLHRIAYLIDHARTAEMLSALDWVQLRRYAAEIITWAAEEDGMADGMMGDFALVQALDPKRGAS